MKLAERIDGRDVPLEIERNGELCRFRLGDAPLRDALVRQVEPCVYSVLIDGSSFEARIETSQGDWIVAIGGRRYEIGVIDPRERSRRSGAAGAEGRQNITAPMPGKVIRVLVATGDSVAPGQGLIVVEAMKMQNEMKAHKAGKVVAIAAREGATVSAGEVLATIE